MWRTTSARCRWRPASRSRGAGIAVRPMPPYASRPSDDLRQLFQNRVVAQPNGGDGRRGAYRGGHPSVPAAAGRVKPRAAMRMGAFFAAGPAGRGELMRAGGTVAAVLEAAPWLHGLDLALASPFRLWGRAAPVAGAPPGESPRAIEHAAGRRVRRRPRQRLDRGGSRAAEDVDGEGRRLLKIAARKRTGCNRPNAM